MTLNRQDNKGARIGAKTCAALIALALCCPPLVFPVAYADDGETTQVEEVSGPSEASPTETTPEVVDPDSQASTEPEPTTPEGQESNSSASAEAESPEQTEEEKKADEEKASNEQSAADKLAQAETLVAHMKEMQTQLDQLRAEYEAARQAYNDTVSVRLKKHVQLKGADVSLDSLKAELTDFITDMYKQGGMTPYYEVLLRSTSYREFLSSWYMMNEVSLYGRDSIRDHVDAVASLKAETEALDAQVAEAENTMKQARVKMKRAELTQLAMAPQVASLRMEAAGMLGDGEMLEEATKEYERASKEFEDALANGLAGEAVLEGDGFFTHPCPGAVYSSGFGYRSFDNAFHQGLDMAIAEGTPYYAAESGTVIASTNDGGYNGGAGNWIVIDHGNGIVTKYMHSLVTFVKPGDHVVRGQNIGLVGNTGNSFGAHLHFQVEIAGMAVNPIIYL